MIRNTINVHRVSNSSRFGIFLIPDKNISSVLFPNCSSEPEKAREADGKRKRKERLAMIFSAAVACLPASQPGSQPVHHVASQPASQQASQPVRFIQWSHWHGTK